MRETGVKCMLSMEMCYMLAGCLLILFNFYTCKCEVLMTSFFYGGVIRCIASLSWTQLTSISRAWMAVLLKLLQKLEKSVMLSKLRGKRWQEISFWITNVLHGSFFLFSVFHLASSQGKLRLYPSFQRSPVDISVLYAQKPDSATRINACFPGVDQMQDQ